MRGERPKEIGLSASGFCSESNPSPGTKISTPEFGYELFVARHFCRMIAGKLQPKVIRQPFNGPLNLPALRWKSGGGPPQPKTLLRDLFTKRSSVTQAGAF